MFVLNDVFGDSSWELQLPSQINFQLPVPSLASISEKVYWMDAVDFSSTLRKAMVSLGKVLAVANPTANGICYNLKYLIMPAVVAPLAENSWAAVEYVYQGSSLLAQKAY